MNSPPRWEAQCSVTKDWEIRNVTFWKFLYKAGAQRKVTFKSDELPGHGNQTKCRLSKVKKNLSPRNVTSRKCLAVGAVIIESQAKLTLLHKTPV